MTLRRDFLAFTAGAVAARTVLPVVAAEPRPDTETKSHPDAELHAACAAFYLMQAERVEADTPPCPFSDDDVADIASEWDDAVNAVTAIQARTVEGLRAKARVLIAALNYEVPEVLGGIRSRMRAASTTLLALSLCRDLVGGLV